MSKVNFMEVETKYRVPGLKLPLFRGMAESLKPKRYIEAAGYDYYYVKDGDEFIRYRAGDLHQLTIKKKTLEANNYVRHEVNLGLKPQDRRHTVDAFCAALGYKYNFAIFKSCFIYYFEEFDVVYYTVYDENMDEVERFLEIEMLEDYPWPSQEAAWARLLEIEHQLKPLGITPQSRVKRSLFEMFRK